MITNTITKSFPQVLIQNSKVVALETSLQQSLYNFKELLVDFEQVHIECDKYKAEFMSQKEMCESKTCRGAEEMKKVIEIKNNIIQLAASTLTKLSETKNWNILGEVFKILFGENTDIQENKNEGAPNIVSMKEVVTPKKEMVSENEELLKDESVSEIEGTPTGRSSPIILTKKMKSHMTSSDSNKKKCPETWASSDNKVLKLTFTTPSRCKQNSKLRQARLNIVKMKTVNVIDITSSPEFCGGSRSIKTETECNTQPLIKKESVDNDDTIMPSPTSERTNYTVFKSPIKFKKPPLKLKSKTEKSSYLCKRNDNDSENKIIKIERRDGEELDMKECIKNVKNIDSVSYTQNDSINILHPDRLLKNFGKSSPARPKQEDIISSSPKKQTPNKIPNYETQSSISLLQNVNNLSDVHKKDDTLSPTKRPLVENINITNVPKVDLEESISLLPRDKLPFATDNFKRRIVELVEEHQVPIPRTRAEKRQLPGWACEKCISFFSELHKDDPEMMQKKINECSHHRGVTNPERPKTPPGYWNPRWNVPDDTEEFNRRNNV